MYNNFFKKSGLYLPKKYTEGNKSKSPFDQNLFMPISHSDLFGNKVPINEINHELSKFNLVDVIKVLSSLNLFLSVHQSFENEVQKQLASELLSSDIISKIDIAIKNLELNRINPQGFVLFHRSQILLLMQKSLLMCHPKRGKRLNHNNKKNFFHLGNLCLKISDYLHGHKTLNNLSREEKIKNLSNEILLYSEIHNDPYWYNELARSDFLLNDCWPESKLEPLSLFQSKTGLTINEFRAFTVSLWGMFNKIGKEKTPNFSINIKNHLNKTKVPNKKLELYLRLTSKSHKELSQEIYYANLNLPEKSFIKFRQFPLIKFQNIAWCIDLGFLVGRGTNGIFWQIHDILNKDERSLFHINWGESFHNYVKNLFENLYPQKFGIFHPFPKLKNSEEIADALLYDGRRLVVVEFKGVPLSLRQKFNNNVDEFYNSLSEKLFKNTKKPQLGKSINKIFSKSGKEALNKLGIDFSKVQIVMPLIICYERAILTPFVHDYIQNLFELSVKNKPKIMANLSLLNINGLEMLVGSNCNKTLLELIEEKINEPQFCGRSLDYKIEEYLRTNNQLKRNLDLDDRSNKILDDMGAYFFGESLS